MGAAGLSSNERLSEVSLPMYEIICGISCAINYQTLSYSKKREPQAICSVRETFKFAQWIGLLWSLLCTSLALLPCWRGGGLEPHVPEIFQREHINTARLNQLSPYPKLGSVQDRDVLFCLGLDLDWDLV